MFENPLLPPTDPKYVAFLAGLKKIAEGEAAHAWDRWDPGEGKWYRWDPADWVLEDVGLADTSVGPTLQDKSFRLGQPDWEYRDFGAPQLFRSVEAAYNRYKAFLPNLRLVWGPWGGGDWRSAWRRPSKVPSPPPPPPPPPGSGLPKGCQERIAWVQDAERRGFVVHDVAQRMINEIVAECT